MQLPSEILDRLKPKQPQVIRELLEKAGVDVSAWAIDKGGHAIENPNTNTYRNSQWSFGGKGEPIVLCIWYSSIKIVDGAIEYLDSFKQFSEDLANSLTSPGRTGGEKQRLRGKIDKARAFDGVVYEAFKKRAPVRVIIVAGDRKDAEDAAVASSKTSERLLDDSSWFIHSYDVYTGFYRIVRDVQPPPLVHVDPFEGIEDPAEDEDFREYLDASDLSETEKDALIKARVGQGPFRQALIERWGGCAVLRHCTDTSVLVASHIVPWSRCVTRAERLGVANGLLLSPTFDKLFDRGLITFDDSFRIMISPLLSMATRLALHIDPNIRLKTTVHTDILPYLKRHRAEVFLRK